MNGFERHINKGNIELSPSPVKRNGLLSTGIYRSWHATKRHRKSVSDTVLGSQSARDYEQCLPTTGMSFPQLGQA